MLKHPIFSLRIGIALAFAFALLSLGVPSLSWAACAGEWFKSDAADTCTDADFEQSGTISNLQCKITATCRISDSPVQERIDTITVAEDQVADLNNCNGWLTVGSC